MTKEHDCLVGIFQDSEGTEKMRESEIVGYARHRYDDCMKWCKKGTGLAFIIEEYLKSTPFTLLKEAYYIFDYCPECGKQVDWKKLKVKINRVVRAESEYYPWAKAQVVTSK